MQKCKLSRKKRRWQGNGCEGEEKKRSIWHWLFFQCQKLNSGSHTYRITVQLNHIPGPGIGILKTSQVIPLEGANFSKHLTSGSPLPNKEQKIFAQLSFLFTFIVFDRDRLMTCAYCKAIARNTYHMPSTPPFFFPGTTKPLWKY